MINFDSGSESLFQRLGNLYKVISQVDANQTGNIVTLINTIATQYSNDPDLRDGLYTALSSHQSAMAGLPSFIVNYASALIIEKVNDDNPQPDRNLKTALVELQKQLEDHFESFDESTCTGTITADADNNSNAVLNICLFDEYGRPLQNCLAEDIVVECTSDSQGGATTAGRESLSVRGEVAQNNAFAADWPQGSGCRKTLTSVLASSSDNLLTNGEFDTFDTTNFNPDNWVVEAGIPGTNIIEATSTGAGCSPGVGVVYIGDGSHNLSLSQRFNSAAGTSRILNPLTRYSVYFSLGVVSALSQGTLIVELVDDQGSVIADEAGGSNQVSIALTSLTAATCTYNTADFITPRVMPNVVKFRVRTGSALANGETLQIENVCITPHTELYSYGPCLTVHTGSNITARGDNWQIRVTNDRAGLWHTAFQRMFNTNNLRIRLPGPTNATAPTIDDSYATL